MKGRIRTLIVYLFTAAFSFLLGLFILDQVILPHLTGVQQESPVPSLEGRSLSDARQICAESGLGLSVQGETYHPSIPASNVMKQDPEAGTLVKPGRQVYVLVSLGPEMVTVPHVNNLTLRQAQILIERNLLKVGEIRTVSDPRVARGRVIEISPPAGEALPHGGSVFLTVSEGVEQVRVPAVIDKPLEEAGNILDAAGLKVGTVSRQFNRFIPEGRVIDQSPLERAQVNVGTAVDLVVSGPEM